ncbi:uncharacterized protein [Blastocystis hominis]|uniref:Thioesterase domain-containing protein n=1 Tax=Blastocystis hominis TaxID=12968 RepID=D8M9F7_BLAHO|nr:uncharacterized protein [Blastocystis hominis]CBK24696.2 unnamed protein product [Blastocystis hominis]|eukprot:XP_012898744.1 uncharacterized protein [Blastocystis hominis]
MELKEIVDDEYYSIKDEHSRHVEEQFLKRVASEGCKELLFPLYPRVDNLFYDGLRKENLIECYRSFTNEEKSVLYSIVSYGKKMCGHAGILHGGASASTLDQFFGIMNCVLGINGFTGQLNLSYRKIILCPSTVLVKGVCERQEGRKHWFKGTIYDEVGDVCVEAECLFIKADIKNVLERARSKIEKTE